MKRARTGSFASASRAPTIVLESSSVSSRRLTKAEKAEVRKMIDKKTPKSTVHNSAAGGPPISGPLASAPTNVCAFTATRQGLAEDQRRGDQIYIDKIHFKGYLSTTALDDIVRVTVLRQSKSGFPPQPINLSAVWQNFGPGTAGVISNFQDDQPCQVLYDKRFNIGTGTGSLNPHTVCEFTLDFSKRPLKCVYQDGTALGSPFNTVEGDIELIVATNSAGLASMTYVYDLVFHEK